MRATSSLIASGCTWVSASMTATSSCRASREAGVELLGLAAVDRVAEHAAALVARRPPRAPPPRCVGRAVVEDEHLEHAGSRTASAARTLVAMTASSL